MRYINLHFTYYFPCRSLWRGLSL